MKLLYVFLGLTILSLAGLSFYYTNIKKEDTEYKATTNAYQQESLYIYREYGEVSFKNISSRTYTEVTDERTLIPNQVSIKTGNGRGYVLFPDNSSITLSSSTEIEINYEPKKISIMQLFGFTYHRVTPLTKNKYEVRTPNTRALVYGTKFAVVYHPKIKKTYIAVTEHQVEVTPTTETGVINNAPVMVQEGSLADIQSSTSTLKNSTSTPRIDEIMIIRLNNEVEEIKMFIQENEKQRNEATSILENKRKSRAGVLNRVTEQTTIEVSSTTTIQTADNQVSLKKIVQVDNKPQEANSGASVQQEPKILKVFPVNTEELTLPQENFIDIFYTAYEKYFFVDEASAYCIRLGTAQVSDMMVPLIAISNQAGFIIPNQADLALFASDLVLACQDGSMPKKALTFTTRFDTTYPY